jgi:hypothetical protein
MLRLPLFLLATSAAAIPSSYLRPLERDLRDMETAIEALNAKAARKGLRLEKTSNAPKTVKVVHPDDESVFFSVKLEDVFTVDALKAKIVTIMKESIWLASGSGGNNWVAASSCTSSLNNPGYNKDDLVIDGASGARLADTAVLTDGQTVTLTENCMVNHGTREEMIPPKKWKALQGNTFSVSSDGKVKKL